MAKQFDTLTGTPVSIVKHETMGEAKVIQVCGVLGRRTRRRAARAARAI